MQIKYFLIIVILATAISCSRGFINAQTADNSALIAQLQAQIASLTAQLQALLAQQGTTAAWCYTFNKNLGFADSGTDAVVQLHAALQNQGISYAPDTGSFYDVGTSQGVIKFQTKYGIAPASGYVGKLTRAKLNSLYGCTAAKTATSAVAKIATGQPSITITSPIGGEQWAQGSTQIIAWTSSGVNNISIDLINTGSSATPSNISIAANVFAQPGVYSWTIPTTVPTGTTYNIQISDDDSGNTSLVSNSPAIGIVAQSTSSLAVSCSASPSSVETGQPVVWSANVSGESGGYASYQWSGDAFNSANSYWGYPIFYTTAGTKNATITATDAAGATATANCSLSVTAAMPSITVTMPSERTVGARIRANCCVGI